MAAVSVTRTDSGIEAVPAGTKIKLQVSPTAADDTVKWQRDSTDAGTGATLEITVDDSHVGKYTATVTRKAGGSDSATFDVSLAAESKPFYEADFAKNAATVIGVVSIVILAIGAGRIIDKTGGDWNASGGNLMFAAALTLPVLVLGGLALAVGLFMAAVEWRGRFQAEAKQPPGKSRIVPALPDNLDKIIESIGKLQGATLVLVVATLLLLGSIWGVASSAAGTAPSASPSPSPSAGATGATGR